MLCECHLFTIWLFRLSSYTASVLYSSLASYCKFHADLIQPFHFNSSPKLRFFFFPFFFFFGFVLIYSALVMDALFSFFLSLILKSSFLEIFFTSFLFLSNFLVPQLPIFAFIFWSFLFRSSFFLIFLSTSLSLYDPYPHSFLSLDLVLVVFAGWLSFKILQ